MNHRFVAISTLLSLLGLVSPQASGEETFRTMLGDSSSRTVRPVLRDSVKYFIKIAPTDSTKHDHMPIYSPDELGKPADVYVPVDKEPAPIKKVDPEYPDEAKRVGMEGTVWVSCLIGKDGTVKETQLMRADAEILIKPAIRAAQQWLFTPVQKDGKPVEVWVSIPFRFKLGK